MLGKLKDSIQTLGKSIVRPIQQLGKSTHRFVSQIHLTQPAHLSEDDKVGFRALNQAYQPPTARQSQIGDYTYSQSLSNRDIATYIDHLGAYWVAIRGTKTASDVYSDAQLISHTRTNTRVQEDTPLWHSIVASSPNQLKVIGHSLGAYVAYVFARDNPLVDKCYLVNPAINLTGIVSSFVSGRLQDIVTVFKNPSDPVSVGNALSLFTTKLSPIQSINLIKNHSVDTFNQLLKSE